MDKVKIMLLVLAALAVCWKEAMAVDEGRKAEEPQEDSSESDDSSSSETQSSELLWGDGAAKAKGQEGKKEKPHDPPAKPSVEAVGTSGVEITSVQPAGLSTQSGPPAMPSPKEAPRPPQASVPIAAGKIAPPAEEDGPVPEKSMPKRAWTPEERQQAEETARSKAKAAAAAAQLTRRLQEAREEATRKTAAIAKAIEGGKGEDKAATTATTPAKKGQDPNGKPTQMAEVQPPTPAARDGGKTQASEKPAAVGSEGASQPTAATEEVGITSGDASQGKGQKAGPRQRKEHGGEKKHKGGKEKKVGKDKKEKKRRTDEPGSRETGPAASSGRAWQAEEGSHPTGEAPQGGGAPEGGPQVGEERRVSKRAGSPEKSDQTGKRHQAVQTDDPEEDKKKRAEERRKMFNESLRLLWLHHPYVQLEQYQRCVLEDILGRTTEGQGIASMLRPDPADAPRVDTTHDGQTKAQPKTPPWGQEQSRWSGQSRPNEEVTATGTSWQNNSNESKGAAAWTRTSWKPGGSDSSKIMLQTVALLRYRQNRQSKFGKVLNWTPAYSPLRKEYVVYLPVKEVMEDIGLDTKSCIVQHDFVREITNPSDGTHRVEACVVSDGKMWELYVAAYQKGAEKRGRHKLPWLEAQRLKLYGVRKDGQGFDIDTSGFLHALKEHDIDKAMRTAGYKHNQPAAEGLELDEEKEGGEDEEGPEVKPQKGGKSTTKNGRAKERTEAKHKKSGPKGQKQKRRDAGKTSGKHDQKREKAANKKDKTKKKDKPASSDEYGSDSSGNSTS